MTYFTGPVHMTNGDLIKQRGSDPILFYNPMERDEAAKSGLPTKNLSDFKLDELMKSAQGNLLEATTLRYAKMLSEYGLTSSKLAIYGKMDIGSAYAIFTGLREKLPPIRYCWATRGFTALASDGYKRRR
jgi:Xaa-Pro aminopeptidase